MLSLLHDALDLFKYIRKKNKYKVGPTFHPFRRGASQDEITPPGG
jgi:hypothetical protein